MSSKIPWRLRGISKLGANLFSRVLVLGVIVVLAEI